MRDIKDLLPKFQALERRISNTRGPFNLFALFLRENAGIGWDLLVSAPWADDDSLEYFVSELRKDFSDDERVRIAQIVIIPPDFEGIQDLAEEHPVEHGKVIIRRREFGLQEVAKGYVITARDGLPAAA